MFGSAADWSATPFPNPRVLPSDDSELDPQIDRVLPMTVIVFRNSLWTTQEVQRRWQRTNEVLKTCGIAVQVKELVETDLPLGIKNVYAPHDHEIADLVPNEAVRPLGFFGEGGFIETFLDDFSADSPARSLIGTIWVGDVAQTSAYQARIRPDYEVVAHEIGHLLGVKSHVRGRVSNLMSGEPGFGDSTITKDQCRFFRQSVYLQSRKPVGLKTTENFR